MKGNLVNSKWFLSIMVASLLMPLSSCSERRESLSSNTRQSFYITYSKMEQQNLNNMKKSRLKGLSQIAIDNQLFTKLL